MQDSRFSRCGPSAFNEDAFRPGGPCSTRSLAPKRLRRGCWSLRAAKLNEHVSQSVLVKSPISEFGSFFEMDYRLSISKNSEFGSFFEMDNR